MTTPTVWKAATCALIALTLAPISVEATDHLGDGEYLEKL